MYYCLLLSITVYLTWELCSEGGQGLPLITAVSPALGALFKKSHEINERSGWQSLPREAPFKRSLLPSHKLHPLRVCVCVEAAQFAPLFAWKTRQLMDEGHGWKTKRGFWDEPYTTCKWRSPHMQVWATALREGRKQSYTPGRLLWSQPLQVHQAAS